MDTPVQTNPPNEAVAGEVGVIAPATSEGAAFVQNLLGGTMDQLQNPPAPQPVAQPVVQQPIPQPIAQQPIQQPIQQPPVAQPVAQQPIPQPIAQQPIQQPPVAQPPTPSTQQIDYSNRYGGEQSAADPLANLQALPELPQEAQIAPPQNMNEQQNHSWAAMRAQMNANRRQAEEFRNKYNQLVESTKGFQSERTSFGEQLNAKDARIKELEDEIGKTDLSKSPAFREKYDAPIQQVRDDIARTLVDNGYQNSDAVELAGQILTTERAQLPDLIKNLPTHVQGIIMINSERADSLWTARDQALTDWRNSAEGLAAVEARGSAMITAQRVAQLTDKAIEIVRSMPAANGQIPAYQVIDPTFAADRDAKEQQFKSWVQQAPEEQKYAAMLEGFMAPKTYEMLENVMRENMELKQAMYGRTRLVSPPIHPATAQWAPPPPPPPQRPTIPTAGYEEVQSVNPAQDFARNIMNQFMPRG